MAREELIDAELDLGGRDGLVVELEALVAAHPLRERAWGQLMLALYRDGRQAEASQAYQNARRTLIDELGIEPGPALKQLHGAILRQEVDVPAARQRDRSGASGAELAEVVTAILAGRVVPVLGEEADGLAARLAERFHYPRGEPSELPRVSQFAAATRGYGPLYDELRDAVTADAEPGPVPAFFASLAQTLRERGAPHQLIVTTSYGSALERAFTEAGKRSTWSRTWVGSQPRQVSSLRARRNDAHHRRPEHLCGRAFAGAPHDHPQDPRSGRSIRRR